jgi:hypothetical protein
VERLGTQTRLTPFILAAFSFLSICARAHIDKYVAFLDMWRRVGLVLSFSEFDDTCATYLRA